MRIESRIEAASGDPGRAARLAYVVFADETEIKWLCGLRRGFRHCFVLLPRGERWIAYDPLSHRTALELLDPPPDVELPAWYAARGHAVCAAEIRIPPPRPALPLPYTCVEATKRILGLTTWRILTPWQLYRYLAQEK